MTRTLLALSRLGLAGLFLYAASTKVADMAQFAEEVANYRILPAALVPAAASAVVGVEIVVGLALLGAATARAAAIVASGLLVLFIGGLSQALIRGIDLTCGCFGTKETATWWTVVRDIPMLAPALAVALFGPGRLLPRAERRAVEAGASERR